MLQFEPSGTDAQDRAPAADDVQRGDRLGEQGRLRYVLPVTSVESWMVLVALARAPSAVYASSMGWSGVPIMGS